MRLLTPLLLATACLRLWAGVPVALSLTNAEDYVSSIPVNSNLLRGVGMGAGGAYTTLRAEDAEFLTAAFVERFHFASGSGGRYTESGAIDHHLARLPTRWDIVEYGSAMISNSYPVTWGQAIEPTQGGTYDRHGFIPADFAIWDGYAPSETPDGWTRNGFGATNDVRAVFLPGASGFAEARIPYALTNLFRTVPFLAAVTNAYAVISSELCSNILASASVYDGESRSCTTNAYRMTYPGHYDVSNYTYTAYSYGGNSYDYPSGYTLRERRFPDITGQRRVGQTMDCWISREVDYATPFGVRRTSDAGGTPQVLEPFKSYESVESSLPSNGAPWTVHFAVVAGTTGDDGSPWTVHGTLYNTNLTVHAWLVSLWECTSAWSWEWSLGLGDAWQSAETAVVSRVIASYPLGELVFDSSQSIYIDASNTLWSSSGDFEGYGTGVYDTQHAFWEVSGTFFDTGSFSDVGIPRPKIMTASDLPAVVSSGWGNHVVNYAQARTVHKHSLRSVKNYAVLIVSPEYFARVVGPYTQ